MKPPDQYDSTHQATGSQQPRKEQESCRNLKRLATQKWTMKSTTPLAWQLCGEADRCTLCQYARCPWRQRHKYVPNDNLWNASCQMIGLSLQQELLTDTWMFLGHKQSMITMRQVWSSTSYCTNLAIERDRLSCLVQGQVLNGCICVAPYTGAMLLPEVPAAFNATPFMPSRVPYSSSCLTHT